MSVAGELSESWLIQCYTEKGEWLDVISYPLEKVGEKMALDIFGRHCQSSPMIMRLLKRVSIYKEILIFDPTILEG